MSSAIRVREFSSLTYHSVDLLIPKLIEIQKLVSSSNLPENIKNLRTNKQRRFLEGWNAAVFLKGISVALNYTEMSLALVEHQDYDFVARSVKNDQLIYTPVQLKEYRPGPNRPELEDEIHKLQKKYPDSSELVVGLWLSGTGDFDFSDLRIPPLNIASLWLFGCKSADQSEWAIIGDMLQSPEITNYKIV